MLDDKKIQWLKTLGYKDDPRIVDCDIDNRTITMKSNGEVATRQLAEVWQRVMGYHRPVSNWNAGKKSEFKDRQNFVESGHHRVSS